jgi:hypothetical protein
MLKSFLWIIGIVYFIIFTLACLHSSFSFTSVFLGYCVLFLVFISFKVRRNVLLFIYNIYILFFFLPRFFIFYFFPSAFGKIDSDGMYILSHRIGLEDDVLFFFSAYYIITYVFILAINKMLPLKFLYNNRLYRNIGEKRDQVFLVFFLILNIISTLFILVSDIGMIGQTGTFHFLFRLLSIPVLTIYFVYIMLGYNNISSISTRNLVKLNFISIFFANVILGSRSFLLTLLLAALVVNYCKSVIEWRKIRFSLFQVVFISILGTSTWYLGTVSRQGEFFDFDLNYTLVSIFSRIGGAADSFISVLNTSDFQVISQHHGWLDSLFKGLNAIIPGDVWPVRSNVTAGQLFKQDVYNNFSGVFHGDYWSGFGYVFAVYGFLTSTVAIFFIVLIFQFILYIQSSFEGLIPFIFSVETVIIFSESFLLQGSADSILLNITVSLFTFFTFFGLYLFVKRRTYTSGDIH